MSDWMNDYTEISTDWLIGVLRSFIISEVHKTEVFTLVGWIIGPVRNFFPFLGYFAVG